jgi:hypothetical protein
MTTNNLIINKVNYLKLKKKYNQAVKDKKESFIFENNILLTSYAKYLLEYMKIKLGVK